MYVQAYVSDIYIFARGPTSNFAKVWHGLLNLQELWFDHMTAIAQSWPIVFSPMSAGISEFCKQLMLIKRALNKESSYEISLKLDEKFSRGISYSGQIVFFQFLHYTCFSSAIYPLQVPGQSIARSVHRSVHICTDCLSASQIAECFPYFNQYTIGGSK